MLPSRIVVASPPMVMPVAAPDPAGPWRGGPAAAREPGTGREVTDWPVARATSPVPGPAALVAGGCCAWPLSLDATCAGEGRRVFREAASGLGLPDEAIYDGMTMTSELAANTLHAQDNIQFDGVARLPVAGAPELWLYLRRAAGRWELVCMTFDSLPCRHDLVADQGGRLRAADADRPGGRR